MLSKDKPVIAIGDQEPFASGGNRLCFRHPMIPEHCLKIIRPERTPAIRRAEKRFPASLRPLATYDENLVEVAALNYLHNRYPIQITRHLPRSFGIVETDLGTAHETDLIHDESGLVSQTLEQYIWANEMNPTVTRAIRAFKNDWAVKPPLTRDLIPHNFVVQLKEENAHLVLIDGFGKKPSSLLSLTNQLAKLRLKHRLKDFDHRVQLILKRKVAGNEPSYRIENLKRHT